MDPVADDLLAQTAEYAAHYLASVDTRPVREEATVVELRAALGTLDQLRHHLSRAS